ncbi:MAG: hypothetical protein ACMUIL_05660 [bacterium]
MSARPGKRVRDERLAAGRRLVDAANSEGAEFILIAGDLCETMPLTGL